MTDIEIIDFLENKINTTNGVVQKEWVNKYDIFTSRKLFKKYNRIEELKEVEKIKEYVLKIEKSDN